MSRITQVLNRRVRPFLLNSIRSLNGLPVPSDSVDVRAYESGSHACTIIEAEPLGRELFPARALSGDPTLVEKTLDLIPDLAVQKKYVQDLLNGKQVDSRDFVCVLEQGRVAHTGGLVITPDNRVLEGVSCINFGTDLPTNPASSLSPSAFTFLKASRLFDVLNAIQLLPLGYGSITTAGSLCLCWA